MHFEIYGYNNLRPFYTIQCEHELLNYAFCESDCLRKFLRNYYYVHFIIIAHVYAHYSRNKINGIQSITAYRVFSGISSIQLTLNIFNLPILSLSA
jgi:hypothetical protein